MKGILETLDTIEQLQVFLDDNQVAIYGIGIYGQCLIDYMYDTNRMACIESIIVTDTAKCIKEYKGIKVQKASSFLGEQKNIPIIIAVASVHQREIVQTVQRYTTDYRCITDRLYYEMNFKTEENVLSPIRKIGFCVAGFPKCGTTSLFSGMESMDSVYLTKNKETVFFDWYKTVSEPEKILEKKYFSDVKEGQVVGMIEPSFYGYAKEIRQLLGNDIRLIFMMRNPVNALFSMFKMAARTGGDGNEMEEIYAECGNCEDMFTEYLQRRISQRALTPMNYAFFLEQFYTLFPREQIKIVFFEELIRNPREQINSILEFAGISACYESDSLPHENSGDYIMADVGGYLLAKRRRECIRARRAVAPDDSEQFHALGVQIGEIQKLYQAAPKVYGLKMTAEQKHMAKAFFDEDVKRLQELTGRDLVDLWDWR